MKHKKLIKHLNNYGCTLLREGSNHAIFFNSTNNKISAVPRHPDVKKFTAHKICKDLEIPLPKGS